MAKKLYVGNMSYGTTEEDLQTAFSKAGTVVSVIIIKDKFSGRPKGFGFVEMGTEEEAQAAIEMWNEKDMDGRPLRVNVAKPMEDRPPRRDNGPRNFDNKPRY